MTFLTFKSLCQIPKLNLIFKSKNNIKFKNKMLEYKGVKYNITNEPNPNGKGLIYQYSINLKEPLKRLNASTFQEARKKVEKIIEEKLKINENNR